MEAKTQEKIINFAKQNDFFDKLSAMWLNNMQGNNKIKEALLLMLAGNPEEIKILLVMDPGMIGSKIFENVSKIVGELNFIGLKDKDSLEELGIAKFYGNSLLGVINPKFGRLDIYTSIVPQIDLPLNLVNQFDLIYTIRDIPNKENDEAIAMQMLNPNANETSSLEFLKEYISYAMSINPQFSEEAINELKGFYVHVRNSGKEDEEGSIPIPISARQLATLIKLSKASARIRLDAKITKEDTKRAIDLLSYCLMQVGFDPETGQLNIDRIMSSNSIPTKGQIKIVNEIIHKFAETGLKKIPLKKIIEQVKTEGISENGVEKIIDSLKQSGAIFGPTEGFIEVLN